jgi:hypothetical protein
MSKVKIFAPNDGDFARKVIELYSHAVARPGAPYAGDQDLDVRRVAFGLAHIAIAAPAKRPGECHR